MSKSPSVHFDYEKAIKHRPEFLKQKQKNDWEPLYDNLQKFDEYDDIYYATHDNMMELLEEYIRQHSEEFVKFK